MCAATSQSLTAHNGNSGRASILIERDNMFSRLWSGVWMLRFRKCACWDMTASMLFFSTLQIPKTWTIMRMLSRRNSIVDIVLFISKWQLPQCYENVKQLLWYSRTSCLRSPVHKQLESEEHRSMLSFEIFIEKRDLGSPFGSIFVLGYWRYVKFIIINPWVSRRWKLLEESRSCWVGTRGKIVLTQVQRDVDLAT